MNPLGIDSCRTPDFFWRYLLLIVVALAAISNTVFGHAEPVSKNVSERLLFVNQLYRQKDYYRVVSEIFSIRFDVPDSSARHELNLYLLKSLYNLDDHQTLKNEAMSILLDNDTLSNKAQKQEIGLLLIASTIEKGELELAESAWKRFIQENESESFPGRTSVNGQVDPEQASFYSGILPGSGFLLSRQYGKAAVSLLLNLLFIYGSYAAFEQEQFGIAGVLLFFEIGWYSGGKKAAAESAQEYNHHLIQKQQRAWIQTRLRQQGLYDVH